MRPISEKNCKCVRGCGRVKSRLRTQISREMSVLHAARIRIEILTQEILIEMVTETTIEIQITEDHNSDRRSNGERNNDRKPNGDRNFRGPRNEGGQSDRFKRPSNDRNRAIEITTETMTEITIEITVLRKKLLLLHLQRM